MDCFSEFLRTTLVHLPVNHLGQPKLGGDEFEVWLCFIYLAQESNIL